LRSSVGLVELPEVFVTHFHADHVLGLPGMFKTFSLRGRELPLDVYGPRGLVDLLGSLKRVVGKLTYEVRLVELEPGDVLERDGYSSSRETLHRRKPSSRPRGVQTCSSRRRRSRTKRVTGPRRRCIKPPRRRQRSRPAQMSACWR